MTDANCWQPIETAPEDENILVATKGGYVDTAFWTDEDGEGRKWWWLETANKYVPHPIPDVLEPTHWMPLPKHPDYKPETVYEKSARWAWPDGRPDL